MLKKRIIPIVLIDGYSVLKTIEFNQRRNLGNPITVAKTYNSRNVDELILLDIDASKQNRSIDLFTISDISSECFMPLTIGGGLRTLEDIKKALKNGADKVSLNSILLENINFVKESSSVFGSQCIVASVDFKEVNSQFFIHSHAGKQSEIQLIDYCVELCRLGAGEILLNNVTLDGKMSGINESVLTLINKVSKAISIPLIYTGGVEKPSDCVSLLKAGADAVGAASIFHFTRYIPQDCKNELKLNGIPARD